MPFSLVLSSSFPQDPPSSIFMSDMASFLHPLTSAKKGNHHDHHVHPLQGCVLETSHRPPTSHYQSTILPRKAPPFKIGKVIRGIHFHDGDTNMSLAKCFIIHTANDLGDGNGTHGHYLGLVREK